MATAAAQPSEAFRAKLFSLQEVAQHATEASLWIVIDTVVYDLTNFVE